MAGAGRSVGRHRQRAGRGRFHRLIRIEDQEHASPAAEEDVPVLGAGDDVEAEDIMIEALGRVEVARIKRGFQNALDGGFLYVFAGPVPASADAALDMVGSHTQLAKLSVTGSGLTFSAPVGNVLPKAPSEQWEGLIAFEGANAGAPSLSPSFYRFCSAADDGRGSATGVRLQGTAGGPASNAAVLFSSDVMTANGSNSTGVSIFNVVADQAS